MIKEAIEFLLEQKRPETVKDQYDRQWSTRSLNPISDSLPKAIEVHTLKAVVDWLSSSDEGDVDGDHGPMIHIESGRTVRVIGLLTDKWNDRAVYVKARPFAIEEFPVGRYMEIEDFIVRLQCSFVDTESKRKIVNLLSSVRGEDVQTAEDDGIAQTVVVENKMRRLEETEVDPIVTLQPFRTFLDIGQPECKYLLRMRREKGSLPVVALFDADGGAWQAKAVEAIEWYFSKNKFVKDNKIVVIA